LPNAPPSPPGDLIRHGSRGGLKMHRFKRTAELSQVRRVLGMLRDWDRNRCSISAAVAVCFSGRCLMHSRLSVTAVDRLDHRIGDIQSVIDGGVERLSAQVGDVCELPFADAAFDGITVLEVLNTWPSRSAAEELTRVARRSWSLRAVAGRTRTRTLALYTPDTLTALFSVAGEIGSVRVRSEPRHRPDLPRLPMNPLHKYPRTQHCRVNGCSPATRT